jgi:hypothetical protein
MLNFRLKKRGASGPKIKRGAHAHRDGMKAQPIPMDLNSRDPALLISENYIPTKANYVWLRRSPTGKALRTVAVVCFFVYFFVNQGFIKSVGHVMSNVRNIMNKNVEGLARSVSALSYCV